MKTLKILLTLYLFTLLISCEPIRYTTKLEPFNIEPPKESPQVKKLNYNAIILIDEEQILRNTEHDYDFGIIHTIEFPVGNILKQILPLYFNQMFLETRYEKNLPLLFPPKTLIITAEGDNIYFKEKRSYPIAFNLEARTKFFIYDNDLLPISTPLLGNGSGRIEKPGLFSYLSEKDYSNTAYQALLKSVNDAIEKIHKAIQNPNAQISEAKKIINNDPTSVFAYKVIANLSLKINDIPEALAASQMIEKLSPNDKDAYVLLHKCYLASKRYKEALIHLEKAISLAPQNRNLILKLNEFYIERGKYNKAIESLERYLEKNPDDNYMPFYLAKLYYKMGKYNEARRIAEKSVESLSSSGIGVTIVKIEDQYPKIKQILPNSPSQKAGLQVNYEITEIDGKSTLPLKLMDIIEMLRGKEGSDVKLKIKKPESEEAFAVTLTRQKFYKDSYAASYLGLLALVYLEEKEKSKAKEYIEEAERFFPTDTLISYAKARYYLQEKEFKKALSIASSLEDNDLAMVINTIAYAKLGKADESVKFFKKIAQSKNFFITEKVRDELLSSLSSYAEGIEKKAYEYEKTGHHALALKEYANLLEISNPQKAQWIRSRVAKIISQNPSLADIKDEARKHFLHAEVLFSNNKLEEAMEELEKASKLQPFNPQIYFNKAIIYEKMSDYANAIENMEIYLQLNPLDPKAQTIKDQIYKWRFILEKET